MATLEFSSSDLGGEFRACVCTYNEIQVCLDRKNSLNCKISHFTTLLYRNKFSGLKIYLIISFPLPVILCVSRYMSL